MASGARTIDVVLAALIPVTSSSRAPPETSTFAWCLSSKPFQRDLVPRTEAQSPLRGQMRATVLLLLPSVLRAATSAGSALNPPCRGATFAVGPFSTWQHSPHHGHGLALRGGGVEGEDRRLDAQSSRPDNSEDIAQLENILEQVRSRVLCFVPLAFAHSFASSLCIARTALALGLRFRI